MGNLYDKWNVESFHLHMQGDARRHNDNIDKGRELCDRCEGTGNQLLSMYQACEKCGGSGYLAEKRIIASRQNQEEVESHE